MHPTSNFTHIVANRDIVFEEFDGEFVILDLASGSYHAVDGSAALVWKLLMEGRSPKAVLDAFEGHANIASGDVDAFIRNLVDRGLLIASQSEDAGQIGDADLAALAGLTKAPEADLFDDLADLILADPIHDVDEEAGWPIRKPQ